MTAKPSIALARHLAESLRSLRHGYCRRLSRCQKKSSEKSVHDLRIATRRMLALVELLRALRAGPPLKKLRKVFKQRLDSFDDLRDTQVQLQILQPLAADFAEAGLFARWLRRREKELRRELRRSIKDMRRRWVERRLKAVEKDLRKSAKAEAPQFSILQAETALRKAFARVRELRGRIQPEHPETIHRLRVAFKRFRYTSELLAPVLPGLTPKRLRQMQALQRRMGDIQDMVVLLAGLRAAVAEGHLSAADARGLFGELMRRQRALIDSFIERVDRLEEFNEIVHPQAR